MRNLLTTLTEIAMLAYWVVAGLLVLDVISIDPALMYSDYQNPLVVAWNWSFFPIDVAFAVCGLTAMFAPIDQFLRFKLEVVASVLMLCVGIMAISYWVITRDFDIAWWCMNLWLVLLGAFNIFAAKMK